MYHNIFRVGTIMQNLGLWFLNDVIWVKTDALPNLNGRRFTNNHETLIWSVKNKDCKKYTFNYEMMKKMNGGKQMKDTDWIFGLCKGKERLKDENMLSGALKSLFAVAENYPDLKSNQNFMQMQRDLTDTEDKIQAARRFYNGTVRDFNTKLQVFPTNLFASMLGFSARLFFDIDEKGPEGQPVKVSF